MPKLIVAGKEHLDPDFIQSILSKPRHFPNFIEAYLQYTAKQESTQKIRKWVAISTLAAAMERKVFYDAGYFIIFPNLYTIIIGDSGIVRKSTSTSIGVDLLREVETIKIMSERLTAASLIQQLERSRSNYIIGSSEIAQSSVFCYASELIVLLREVFGSISELLTTFYDCVPNDSRKPWIYETKGEGQVRIFGPCLNLLGASTPTWLARAIPADEMEGGFASRVIFVVEKNKPDQLVAWPELDPETAAMKPKLIEDLKQIHFLRGNFRKTPAADAIFTEFYARNVNAITKLTDPRFKGYFGRKPTMVIKLAMILSVAEGNSLEFDARHIESAIQLLDDIEIDMFDAFGASGSNKLSNGLHAILGILVARGQVSHREIMQTFWRDYSGKDLLQILDDITEMGFAKSSRGILDGKTDTIYYYSGPAKPEPQDGL